MSGWWLFLGGAAFGSLLPALWHRATNLIPSVAARRRHWDRIKAKRLERSVQRLNELVQNVSGEVERHRGALLRTGEEIAGLDPSSPDFSKVVLQAAIEIMQLNARLQGELDTAESRLREQAWQLESQTAQALTDPLTGLPNRRAFDTEIKRRLAQWQRKQTPFSVVLLDVDHFKRLNDEYGHPAGDAVLTRLAEVLQAVARESDMPARIGGEEFAVILSEADARLAAAAAERFRRAIANRRFEFEGREMPVTVSCGAASIGAGVSIESLMKRADDCLYAAKENGRNRVFYHLASGPHPFDMAEDELPEPIPDAAEELTPERATELELQTLVDNLQHRLAEICSP
ncbi:MAG: GGDEF domain-containing protein [Planctomycetota bacterium]|nr:MAG: GGDEF domain-containing protein [Planctomycetota bacterium]